MTETKKTNNEKTKPDYLEWYRVTTEFFSKMATPTIALILLLLYAPQLLKILDELIKRQDLERIEIGELKLSFATEEAQRNSQIAKNTEKINVIERALPQEEQKEQIQQINQRFQANSSYNVFIFHRDSRLKDATEIVNKLLNQGYSSSAIPTDLREAKPRPENTVRILYTNTGQERIEEVKEIINELISDKKIDILGNIELENKTLKRGDIQVLLY